MSAVRSLTGLAMIVFGGALLAIAVMWK